MIAPVPTLPPAAAAPRAPTPAPRPAPLSVRSVVVVPQPAILSVKTASTVVAAILIIVISIAICARTDFRLRGLPIKERSVITRRSAFGAGTRDPVGSRQAFARAAQRGRGQ